MHQQYCLKNMAQKRGQTGNPHGRPVGAKGRLTLTVRETITKRIENDIDNFFEELNSLSGKDYVRCMTELLKLIVPRPLNDEESDNLNINSELIKRLFNNN